MNARNFTLLLLVSCLICLPAVAVGGRRLLEAETEVAADVDSKGSSKDEAPRSTKEEASASSEDDAPASSKDDASTSTGGACSDPEAYTIDGTCIGSKAVFLGSKSKEYEYSKTEDWSSSKCRAVFSSLFSLLGDQASDCWKVLLGNPEPAEDDCTCKSLCKELDAETGGSSTAVCKDACEEILGLMQVVALPSTEAALEDPEEMDTTVDLGEDKSKSKPKPYTVDVDDLATDTSPGTIKNNDGGGDSGSCFPLGTLVTLENGSFKRIEDVMIGETVLTVSPQGVVHASPVYGFAHYLKDVKRTFVQVDTSSGLSLLASPDHYVYVAGVQGKAWQQRVPVPAGKLEVGHAVWMHDVASNQITLTNVSAVQLTEAQGLINPFTLSGTIIVNNIAASIYNDLMGSESTMHSFTIFIRWIYRIAPKLTALVHTSGIDKALSENLIRMLNVAYRQQTMVVVSTAAQVVSSLPGLVLPEPGFV